ncbi:hypothetical protein Pmar_PMAR005712 [Perkinsus marinus ATCC 50983]|uniref:Uncharacterized protein n=1 Tax=Perkinsus marinus (strain ATCC 50983 / TXsc) TaxID=423536 RepID=C5L268_PERM5|nr:hypothetical protein Pmar_PMAR005712 [Perkinsus marinus ATCC 50983]EER09169.1 hypothetical protein Pmar_PMAR005712 [Perkinsus marinus ATCC 50983]|eukprot:XP_002777353.1 hypothetical protein Pmar_PMAR005712 [Perkinsus marinus ATCC 50983]
MSGLQCSAAEGLVYDSQAHGQIARKIQITAFVLYHGPHSSSSAILKLADALKTTGEWKLDLKKVRDGFLKLSPSMDNRVSVYM